MRISLKLTVGSSISIKQYVIKFWDFRLYLQMRLTGYMKIISNEWQAPPRGTYSAVDLGHGENGGVGVFGREIVGVVGRGGVRAARSVRSAGSARTTRTARSARGLRTRAWRTRLAPARCEPPYIPSHESNTHTGLTFIIFYIFVFYIFH